MHIADGTLTGSVLLATAAAGVVGVGVGLAKMDQDSVPRVGVLSAVFFVASLIRVPIGATSVHLMLIGLLGCLLGWTAWPALACALLLQAIVFGCGGLTSLGANVLIMAAPASVCYLCLGRYIRRTRSRRGIFMLAFSAGVLGVALSWATLASVLFASGKEFTGVIGAALVGHLPIMVIEGFVTAAALMFLHRVRPELLASPHLQAARKN